jgi:hypothetical protein
MDDWQVARLALDAVRTATRLAEQEQRRRRRQQAAQNTAAPSRSPREEKAPQRQPAFDMPTSANGDIPDEFLPRL